MKALNVNNRKVEDFREDGRALFDGSQRQTAYESPSDPERVYPIDRFGYARSVYSAAVEQACNCGRRIQRDRWQRLGLRQNARPLSRGG